MTIIRLPNDYSKIVVYKSKYATYSVVNNKHNARRCF